VDGVNLVDYLLPGHFGIEVRVLVEETVLIAMQMEGFERKHEKGLASKKEQIGIVRESSKSSKSNGI
jgi:hypothetical protein